MKMCMMLLLLLATNVLAQERITYPGRPRYPDGLLGLSAGGGVSKYFGEFTDHSYGSMFTASASYSVWRWLSLGAQLDAGTAWYERRIRGNIETMYRYQFDTMDDEIRSTTFTTFLVNAYANLFPYEYVNVYLLAGGGATLYSPEDFENNAVKVKPKRDFLACPAIAAGFGFDIYLSRRLALRCEARNVFLLTDDFDAFSSKDIQNAYMAEMGQEIAQGSEGIDSYASVTLGLSVYLFENSDLDADRLSNTEEGRIGSNPYAKDTDTDGLSDYDEQYVTDSDPIVYDTDNDGLSDFDEVRVFHTSPRSNDSDGDGLLDFDELKTRHTNPLQADSDEDGLNDYVEVHLGTSPLMSDTDSDKLTDYAEVRVHGTDPMTADSDGDGFSDFEELRTYVTDPRKSDTDDDGLIDFEEVVRFGTNPRAPDTDGEGLADGAELRQYGTNPVQRDTDGDGIDDAHDACPLLRETLNGIQDDDGCPEEIAARGRASTASGSTHRSTEVLYPGRSDTVRADPRYPPSTAAGTTHRSSDAQYPGRVDTVLLPGPGSRPEAGMGGGSGRVDTVYRYRVDTVYVRQGSTLTLYGVVFDLDMASLRPDARRMLDLDLQILLDHPNLVVEVQGHTDSQADDDYNIDLSIRRAEAVREYFISKGVAPERLSARGYGERQPIDTNATPEGRQRNRRIELVILQN